jgi:asparagine synthase (glutamine-hydrolysing)
MCGLCGVVLPGGKAVSQAFLARMNGALAHRGPDGEGFFIDGNVGLGHRRLSIIDLQGGAQPLFNEDGSIGVVFNGEIYNYRELTKELLAQGHKFRTHSDTETLVHLYEQHGMQMLHRLRGMFAFALYDRGAQTLHLVRDRFGIKPLYYHIRDGALYFASEIKPLIEGGYSVEVNRRAIHLYLQSRFAHSDETIFKGIHRLPEGSYLRWRNGDWYVERYYSNPRHGSVDDGRDFQQLFEEELASAVESHMVADVPVGAYLSGGVDSSVVVSEMVRQTGHPVRTFCVDFKEGYSEAGVAERTARSLGCDHHTVLCGVEELLQLPRVIAALEEPVGDAVVVAQYFLSRTTRNAGIKVVMTGDGADETLGGYQYLAAIIQALRWGRALPNPVARLGAMLARILPLTVVDALANVPLAVAAEARERLAGVLERLPASTIGQLYDLLLALYRPDELRDLYTPAFFEEAASYAPEPFAGAPDGKSLADQVLSVQFRKWLPANINLKQDRLCMAHSVENRVPFLDHRFVESMTSFPQHTKIQGRRSKILLRELARKRGLDNAVVNGRKTPFHLPLERYLGDRKLWEMVEDNLSEERVMRRGFVSPAYVKHVKEQSRSGNYMLAKKMFALVILELWHRNFVDGESSGPGI